MTIILADWGFWSCPVLPARTREETTATVTNTTEAGLLTTRVIH